MYNSYFKYGGLTATLVSCFAKINENTHWSRNLPRLLRLCDSWLWHFPGITSKTWNNKKFIRLKEKCITLTKKSVCGSMLLTFPYAEFRKYIIDIIKGKFNSFPLEKCLNFAKWIECTKLSDIFPKSLD
jgi:hypothetical protein